MLEFFEKVSGFLTNIFGDRNERIIQSLVPTVNEVKEYETEMMALSDQELREKREELQQRHQEDGESLDDLLPEAFALVREVASRTIGMRHYDVQIMGGIVLHQGNIAEMVTGEGKTLVATAPAVLNTFGGESVHIVTVNDYLARRDAQWMGPVYHALGLKTAAIQGDGEPFIFDPDYRNDPGDKLRNLRNVSKPEAYEADVIYGTNNEFGFDYLRDNMKVHPEDQCQQSRNFAIVDEVDNILIDESRTPLIISGPADEKTEKYYEADRVARKLQEGEHYEVKEKENQCILTEEGIEKAENIIGVDSFYTGSNMDWPHHIEQAVQAHELYERDSEYVVKEGDVVIVDEFTGRLMPGRRWSDGLHQAVEAKENLSIRKENQTLASITLQNFFNMYDKLSGMTGTAATEAMEFEKIYDMEVVVIPTNEPLIRESKNDLLFRSEEEKFKACADEIERMREKGRPVLVGTTSIEKSEKLSNLLDKRGVPHEVLNAKQHEREANIVAQAGEEGAVTIATNMAGRGTDIELGEGVAERGGLHVIGTERHEARRIDNQLRGRAGRQGDPGSSQFFISLDDDLLRIFAGDWVKNMMNKGMEEGEAIESGMISNVVERAQKKKESHNFQVRKDLLEYDEVMNEQRKLIYSQRQEILHEEGLREMIINMIEETVGDKLDQFLSPEVPQDEWDYEAFRNWVQRAFGFTMSLKEIEGEDPEDLFHQVLNRVEEEYDKREEELGEEEMRRVERFILLDRLDEKWKDHLYNMEQLRDSIGFRGYAKKDPKIEYKREGYNLFQDTIDAIKEEITELILKIQVATEEEEALEERWLPEEFEQEDYDPYNLFDDDQEVSEAYEGAQAQGQEGEQKPVQHGEKVGRNEPCPCGSGKKYKKCCGKGSYARR